MSFWEEIGSTITEGSAGFLQKLRDETGAVSLRAENAAAERKIRTCYEEMGRLLAEGIFAQSDEGAIEEVLSQDPAPSRIEFPLRNGKEIYKMIKTVREQRQLIAENEKKIVVLTGIIVCPGCGKMVDRKSAFCPGCGRKIEWPADPDDDIMDGEFVPAEEAEDGHEKAADAAADVPAAADASERVPEEAEQ